jgi:hypothetical protein
VGAVSDSVQPGTEIDAELWRQFREEVEARRGGVRGHLRNELENALRAYIRSGDATPAELNERLARIEAAVGVEATDGGTDTSEPRQYTERPGTEIDDKPHENTSTHRKVAWLARRLLDNESIDDPESWATAKPTIFQLVKDEYRFTDEKCDEYVTNVIDYLDLVAHPENDVVVMTEAKRAEYINKQERERREQGTEEARAARDRLDDAEVRTDD